jgi:hypothetical protein
MNMSSSSFGRHRYAFRADWNAVLAPEKGSYKISEVACLILRPNLCGVLLLIREP